MDAITGKQDTMANPDPNLSVSEHGAAVKGAQTPSILISLPLLAHGALGEVMEHALGTLGGRKVLVASPDGPEEGQAETQDGVTLVGYTPAVPPVGGWSISAADFLNAHALHARYGGQAIAMLGAEAQTLGGAAIAGLADAVLSGAADLALARYDLSPRAGLVNSAILYPVTRALFAARPRFPLALDLAVSPRMLERLAAAAGRLVAANQPGAIVWPVSEAATAGFTVTEVAAGPRVLPQPDADDLNTLLAQVIGSLFSDVDSRAAWWQRARPILPGKAMAPVNSLAVDEAAIKQVQPMLDTFRNAYGNLHELWSLVLPPQSLLGLKRLSVAAPSSFQMADSLWARIVYDFLLAYRLRTINRGHLLGALTPLYLAWVASHLLLTASGGDPERHIEAVAAAFEADKPYLVSRWRWPDRFNP